MPRAKRSGLAIAAALPWPVGLVLGIVAFFGIRYGIGAYLASLPTGIFQQVGPMLSKSITPLAWFALIGCLMAAVASFFKAQKRKKLLEA